MSNTNDQFIAELKKVLTNQTYSPVVIENYCTYAGWFLEYLARRDISIAEVTEAEVDKYLRHAMAIFRKRHDRLPGARWHAIPRSGIHALLRLSQGQWPPARKATCAAEVMSFAICDEYETWLREERGLAEPSIYALMWEGRNFLAWQLDRCALDGLMEMSVGDIDRYMDTRSPHQTRKSVKDVAERLRSLLVAPRSTCRRTSSLRRCMPTKAYHRSWSAARLRRSWSVRGKTGRRWDSGTMRSCNCSRPMA